MATVGIFLPAFFFVAVSGPLVPRLRRSAIAGDVLDGVNVGSLALMSVVSLQLGVAAIADVTTVAIALASAVLLIRYRLNSTWLVLGGAMVASQYISWRTTERVNPRQWRCLLFRLRWVMARNARAPRRSANRETQRCSRCPPR